MIRATVLAIALLLGTASPSIANTARWTPARDHHRTPRMTFNLAVRIADAYWAKRNVPVPCQPRPVFLTYGDTKGWDMAQAMYAGMQDCTITITPWADLRGDPDLGWMFCQQIVHEVGHIAGLPHSTDPDSIMAASPWVVPWGCSHPRRSARLMAITGQLEPQRH